MSVIRIDLDDDGDTDIEVRVPFLKVYAVRIKCLITLLILLGIGSVSRVV